ncbi:sodium-dependent bicarbonate transport family permease [Paenibacillus sp. GCM10027627]|uniref:sodium-dependent bicarbonate transport family permease n=1 Tax=unclassified Paenibacillus TaxID=185978 RepID=UPI0036394EB2
MYEIVVQNLLSPAVLFFALGLVAVLVKSDLKFPQALSDSLSIYLLAAIGLKGGMELSKYDWNTLARPIGGALLLGALIPIATFGLARKLGFDRNNAAALAATYGSVSIVTYGAAVAFLGHAGIAFEGFMGAMVVLMESPAIFISLLILGWLRTKESGAQRSSYALGIVASGGFGGKPRIDPHVIRESLFGKSILLLLGALLVGLAIGQQGMPMVKPLFIDLYPGVLMIFLLGMGLAAGERLSELKQYGFKPIVMGIVMPLAFGAMGVLIGGLCGLSTGGAALMGVLGASASYIAAPAALKTSIPEANPSVYLGMSLGITFPFNLIIGIPLYVQMAQWLS